MILTIDTQSKHLKTSIKRIEKSNSPLDYITRPFELTLEAVDGSLKFSITITPQELDRLSASLEQDLMDYEFGRDL